MQNWFENGAEMAQISVILFSRHCTVPLFFVLAPPRRAPPFSVNASGAVVLKMAQMPSTASAGRLPLF